MSEREYELVWRFPWRGKEPPQREQFIVEWTCEPTTASRGGYHIARDLNESPMAGIGTTQIRKARKRASGKDKP